MSDHNPLDIIGRHFAVEFMNPNPRMTPLSSGDRYTLTVEVDKELFDLFCEAGREGRAGMILEGMMMVTERHNPVGYENESVPAIEVDEEIQSTVDALLKESREEEPVKIDHTNSRLAAMYCKQGDFQDFIASNYFDLAPSEVNEAYARKEILQWCNIESRAELDTNLNAKALFVTKFCKPYTSYMQQRG